MKSIGHAALIFLFWTTLLSLIYRSAKRSDNPALLILKWGITGILIFAMFTQVLPLIIGPFPSFFASTAKASAPSRITVIMGMLFMSFGAVILGVTWASNWTTFFLKPFTGILDGGDEEIEAQPVYSKANLLRGKGQYHEAIAEIRGQLEKFPHDFTGQMWLAEIEAENLKDLQAAGVAIEKAIHHPGRAPSQISGALNSLADWHLKIGQDPDSARLALEKIIARLPGSSFAQAAVQRIAHLSSLDQLLATHDRPTIAMKAFDKNIGLQKSLASNVNPSSESPAEQASHYVLHLQKHPLDTEARENLALIYAENYQNLELAIDQLEQLLTQPQQPAKQIVHWLNLMADLQIRIGHDIAAAEKTIRRISNLFPNTAYDSQAVTRLQSLRLEAKRYETSQAVKLGSYKKDLGLKKITG